MHVAEVGTGPPLLLLHGFPQHWWEWRGIITGLASRYRVICPDLRGAGWTDASHGMLIARSNSLRGPHVTLTWSDVKI
jgi:pimeloyl-ACP methyl ester carboxylesterase